jgi:NitT/TauT family transport system permease protein
LPHYASTTRKAGAAVLFAIFVIASWIYASRRLPSYILPPPSDVLDTTIAFFRSSLNMQHLASTVTVIAVSIVISFVLGSILAALSHYLAWLRPLINYRITPFLNSFSAVGWTLLGTIWFGVTRSTVIFSISIILLPFAIINIGEGFGAMDKELGEMARSFGRAKHRLFLLIVVPAILPFAIATLRIMFGVAWKVALTAELFGGSSGLGYLLNLARQDYDMTIVLTIIILIILSVYLTDRVFLLPLERWTDRKFGTSSP